MDFSISAKGQDYLERVKRFMANEIVPVEAQYHRELAALDNRWVVLPVIRELKAKAREQGLWNLFFPDDTYGCGLLNSDYALIAEETGRSFIAPEIFNCNAPDTGNMEVLIHYGSDQQKAEWLPRLLSGEVRSAFCMTEPDVASSDATTMAATATVDGDEVVLNGRKWWSTGVGHPDCKVAIFMGVTATDAAKHRRHSMVLVPMDAPGVSIERMLPVFGAYDEPYGHGVVAFDNVRLPVSAFIAGPGRGFEVAQGRLGPGRVHHCMRAIGAAERALELLIKRAVSREAFGRPLAKLGGNVDKIANARMAIEQARLLTLKCAWALDTKGITGALQEVSMIKALVPQMLQTIVDDAIQIHGGAGVSDDDFPLTALFAYARVLRLADGPDEVHRAMVARLELRKYK
ncbi:acyl-CoA dehydrogenase family protein [Marinobacter sp. M3C]|jgi:alkylation response protein AidB-like acyl-CoA dehydrogenase|uniref:acyl-CoA dehydrogenase family protein n=1 Tax=unclassified Marinobacter TaxID=83889 RepID=UPI00200C96A0|nr:MULTISPECIES: acyl-CoA dehydrogenase family protein [unclassified Marinobacter]MCL1482139.1 acyl-CoA dehydrogenase family protein [Marinobacter sp.]MCL1483168.1 acyl-CoA dehydrogenase family protein [Marinobacter sp.]MCL1488550.1 acyl-CoA dehydrogenase family protein [Marinobacter sp.]UQG54605.1 acyl-CoA dehydrogenase family protein [Marinobacter sp. M4C]UQG60021.1 acyl-CoA dehydrogenase family protein [Marinobacter sp. M3C]